MATDPVATAACGDPYSGIGCSDPDCKHQPATAAKVHDIEWAWAWFCTCGTRGSTQSQADTHRRLHSDD